MKIQYASDLHLEFAENRDYIDAGGSGTRIGETALLCNQLGYVFQNEHRQFDAKAVIELL